MSQFSSAQAQFRSIMSMLQMMDQCIEVKQQVVRLTRASGPEPGSALVQQQPTVKRAPKTVAPKKKGKTPPSPRFRIKAKIIIHKNDRYIKGRAVNISKSGMFVCSDRAIFKENEIVRIAIKPLGMTKYYKSIARVVRFNEDGRYLKGYGLQFVMPTA